MAYTSVISQIISDYLPISFTDAALYLGFLLTILVQLRNLRAISYVSAFGSIVYAIVFFSVVIDGFAHKGCCFKDEPPKIFVFSGIGPLLGTVTFALEGIPNILPSYQRLGGEDKKTSMKKILFYVFLVVTILYVVFSDVCYASYGSGVQSPVTQSVVTSAVAYYSKLLVALILSITYLIQMYPITNMVDTWVNNYVKTLDNLSSTPLMQHEPSCWDRNYVVPFVVTGVIRLLLVVFVTGITISVKSFSLIVNYTGAVAGSTLGIVLPMIFYMRVFNKMKTIEYWLVIVFGIAVGVLAIVNA